MATKTIYVADDDLGIFNKAQELAGSSLSAVIVQALHRFVESQEHQTRGFHEITVRVGKPGTWRELRFTGRVLAKWRERHPDQPRSRTLTVFQTAKGRLALYTRDVPNWVYWEKKGWEHYCWPDYNSERTLEVYDTLEALEGHIPDEMYAAVERTLKGIVVEDLDI